MKPIIENLEMRLPTRNPFRPGIAALVTDAVCEVDAFRNGSTTMHPHHVVSFLARRGRAPLRAGEGDTQSGGSYGDGSTQE